MLSDNVPSEFDPTVTLTEILAELADGRRPLESLDVVYKLKHLAGHLEHGGSLPDVVAATEAARKAISGRDLVRRGADRNTPSA